MFLSGRDDSIVYSIAEKQKIENLEELISLQDNLMQRKNAGEISFLPNMVFNYFANDMIAYLDNTADNKMLYVHKITKNTELAFEGVYNDVLFVQNGFVYRSEDGS